MFDDCLHTTRMPQLKAREDLAIFYFTKIEYAIEPL
jgi:hypothetical protein